MLKIIFLASAVLVGLPEEVVYLTAARMMPMMARATTTPETMMTIELSRLVMPPPSSSQVTWMMVVSGQSPGSAETGWGMARPRVRAAATTAKTRKTRRIFMS